MESLVTKSLMFSYRSNTEYGLVGYVNYNGGVKSNDSGYQRHWRQFSSYFEARIVYVVIPTRTTLIRWWVSIFVWSQNLSYSNFGSFIFLPRIVCQKRINLKTEVANHSNSWKTKKMESSQSGFPKNWNGWNVRKNFWPFWKNEFSIWFTFGLKVQLLPRENYFLICTCASLQTMCNACNFSTYSSLKVWLLKCLNRRLGSHS